MAAGYMDSFIKILIDEGGEENFPLFVFCQLERLLHGMKVLGLTGGPGFLAASMTAQAGIFNGEKAFGNGRFHAFFLDLFEHVGIGIRIYFEEMAMHVAGVTGNRDSGFFLTIKPYQ